MDAIPDLAVLSDDDLESLLRRTEDDEESISRRRRRLHDRIDALRGERVARLRGQVAAGTFAMPAPAALERPIFEGRATPRTSTPTSRCRSFPRSRTTSSGR